MLSASAIRTLRGFAFLLIAPLAVLSFAGCGDDDTVKPKKPAAVNKVLELDGDGDYVTVPFANHAFATFTVEVKVKVPTYSTNVHFVSLQQNAYLVIGDWDASCLNSWAAGLNPVDAADGTEPEPSINEWHHFAISYDGTNQYVLIDGVVVAVRASTGTVTNSASYVSGLKIGSRYAGTSQFAAGQIDEVRVWNIFRTETQIRDNMNKAISAQIGLVGYWNFDDGTADDLSGNDADGTLMGDAAIVNK